MVLPIGDAPNPRGVPVVTYLLSDYKFLHE